MEIKTAAYLVCFFGSSKSDPAKHSCPKEKENSMESIEILTLLFLLALLLAVLNKNRSHSKRLPPGPFALPIFGNVFQLAKHPGRKLSEWAKIYGPIFKIKMGTQDTIIISDHKLLKELFNDNSSTGRLYDNPLFLEYAKGPNGLGNAEGKTSTEQRRFILKSLKILGFAKTSMEQSIIEEALVVVKWFTSANGKPISANGIFIVPVVNSLWRIISGERGEWERGTSKIAEALHGYSETLAKCVGNGIYFAPVLRHIAPELLGWNAHARSIKMMDGMVQKCIDEHKKTFDSNNLRDLIDHYLMEIQLTTDSESSFFKETGELNLRVGLLDLFAAGGETTSITLSWSLLYLSQYSLVQKRMQKEITERIGSRQPALADRAHMPYTEAFIQEILRITSIVYTALPHKMLEDKVFHGYMLPKGISILANIYGIHFDNAVWGDPVEFRPERFLNEDGTKCLRHDALVAFSEGKRKCIGESLARDTMFLFLTCILQEFDILPENTNTAADFEPKIGFFLEPKPFKVIMSPRT